MGRLSLEAFAAKGLKAQRAVDAVMRKGSKGDTSLVVRRPPPPGPPGDDLPEYVTAAEVADALAHLVRTRRIGSDDGPAIALVAFLWSTGCRVSEALALTPAAIDVQHRTVRLPTLKRRRKDGSGRKTSVGRVVPIAGRQFLPIVLARIVALRLGPQDRVFPFGRQHAWRIVSEALRAAGVEPGRATPHALRHGHAVHAVQHGTALNLIQRQLGHASIANTAIYLRVTAQDVRTVYDGFDW